MNRQIDSKLLLPDGLQSHHFITSALFSLQVLLSVLQFVWDEPQLGLHVINDILELCL